MTEFLRADADGAIGNWTGEDGRTTNLFTSVNESTLNLANYIQSGVNPTNDKVRLRYGDPTGLITSGKVRYTYGKKNNNSTVVNIRTQLVQGASTIIASWDHADVPYTPATVAQDLTGPQLTSITDFTDLWIEHIANPATVWSPLSLGAKLIGWWDPKDTSTLYQTEDTSTPVTANGQAVGRISDKSGNGYHLVQATGSRRPLYNTTGLGASSPSIDPQDLTDGLYCTGVPHPGTAKLTGAGVFRFAATSDDPAVFLGFFDPTGNYIHSDPESTAIICQSVAYIGANKITCMKETAGGANAAVSYDTRFRAISQLNGTTHDLMLDGTDATQSVGSVGGTAFITTGNSICAFGGMHFGIDVGSLVGRCGVTVLCNDVLTSGEKASLNTYLAAW